MKKNKIETRVGKLEARNKAADVKSIDDKTISIKEVYERIVALETRFDILMDDNRSTSSRFLKYVYSLLFLSITNLVISILIYLLIRG